MRIIIYICLTLVIKTLALKTNYQQFKAVPLSGPSPTINTGNPDLSEATNYYDCFSIADSKACDGMDLYIPDTGVYYSTASSFDAYVNGEINNDSGILVALCPNANIDHDLMRIAYRYSLFCGRFMYAQARWCKENSENIRANPKLSLCKSTCLEYAQSIEDYGKTVCKNTDNSMGEKIKQNIINKWCNLFTDDEGCVKGTKKESKQCGYNSAIYASEAQTYNPNNKCFVSDSKESKDVIIELEEKATVERNTIHEMGSIKWKILYPIALVVIICIITAIFWNNQNKKYKIGFLTNNSTISEYEFVPSNAKPSREYVDEDFIKKFELEIPKASVSRSSSLAVKEYNKSIRVNEPNDSTIYMIAIYNYHPRREDEIELKFGDRIRIEHEYEDGWGAGVNESTNEFGAFPMICCSSNVTSNQEELPKRNKSRARSKSPNVRKRQLKPTSPLANASVVQQ